MDHKSFKEFSGAMTDYITNYLENIRDRRVLPTVEPGYLRPLIPEDAPENAEKWQDIMTDIEKVIMPGVTHWHSPRFHAYYPTANSYPAIVADMLSDTIACIGFSWIASPACTELEVVMLDWLGKLLDLPKEFLACSGGKGGGVIQGTASEATLVALLGAKARMLRKVKEQHPEWSDYEIISKFRAYASKQSHSSVERAGLLGGVQFVHVETDEKYRLRGEPLARAIEKDIKDGLIPFYVVATLGTTSSCAFDVLEEIGDVCIKNDVWLHVDAAYAGSAFICPEYRHLMAGIEKADSFNFNPHKWMLVTFDCSAMWLKDPTDVIDAFNVDPLYLKHDQQGSAPDYRVLCVGGLVYKVWTSWESERVTLSLQKANRDWVSRGFAVPTSLTSIFIDLTFGTYTLVTFAQLFGHIAGDPNTVAERLLNVIGFIMMTIIGGILITSVDEVPDRLNDNAIILGVIAFVAGILLLTDAGTKCQKKKKAKPVVVPKRDIEIVPRVEEKKEEQQQVPVEPAVQEKKEEPKQQTNGIRSVEIRIKDPTKNWPVYGQRSKTIAEIETLDEADRVDRMLQSSPDVEQEPVLLQSRRGTASVQASPIKHTSSFYIGGPFSWRRLNEQGKQ